MVNCITDEQVREAKEYSLMDYLDHYEGHLLKRSATNEWKIEGIPGLLISNGKFNHTTEGYGGSKALDYLIKVRQVPFKEAVAMLSNRMAIDYIQTQSQVPRKITRKKEPKPIFQLPLAASHANDVKAYLTSRGIDPGIIQQCLDHGSLYQSKKYQKPLFTEGVRGEKKPLLHTVKRHEVQADETVREWEETHQKFETMRASCVFVGFKPSESPLSAPIPAYASYRSTTTTHKADTAGSSKRYGFCLPAQNPNSKNLAVFESPIDALSHATLSKHLNSPIDMHRLSLGGLFSSALKEYLVQHPDTQRIYLCLDNDEPGQTATQRIVQELQAVERHQSIKVLIHQPVVGKDFNEMLMTQYPHPPTPAEKARVAVTTRKPRHPSDMSL